MHLPRPTLNLARSHSIMESCYDWISIVNSNDCYQPNPVTNFLFILKHSALYTIWMHVFSTIHLKIIVRSKLLLLMMLVEWIASTTFSENQTDIHYDVKCWFTESPTQLKTNPGRMLSPIAEFSSSVTKILFSTYRYLGVTSKPNIFFLFETRQTDRTSQ